ncbi:hypothetical protein A6M14_06010 [Acinetobacter sp. Ac_877]|uniref:hypothetical protein n=1 Tax=Acinetobacter portensis TaxID=1839785 RepID=UPI00128BA6E0|nr:hypothetical protein [Acinetobacter portensis]MPW40862.1 hypothetical protein [Acinetobacter portensis]
MKKSQAALLIVISLAIGSIAGYVSYSQLTARYVAATTACTIITQAVDNKLLTAEQVKELGTLTGQELNKSYASVASKLALTKAQVDAASPDSTCSQFLVGINQAK